VTGNFEEQPLGGKIRSRRTSLVNGIGFRIWSIRCRTQLRRGNFGTRQYELAFRNALDVG
jgi:hypothetical protein